MPRINRYRERLAEVFPAFLHLWLAKLSAEGFTGTSAELWDAMDAARKPFDMLPFPNVLLRQLVEHAATVAAAGWRVRTHRTARARLVKLTRD